MRSSYLAVSGVLFLTFAAPLVSHGQELPAFGEPGISPDGQEVAFVSGGDIWTVSSTGGEARLLVAHSANESRPMYSPDGRWLAFNSNRDGSTDIYLLELSSGDIKRVTFSSGGDQLDGWSRDSDWLYFSSNTSDIGSMTDIFRVRMSGGTPMPVIADRYEGEFFAAAGPGGQVAISTRGNMARSQWWRNGHSHIDEAEIWLVSNPGNAPDYQVLSTDGKNLWPMWSTSGDELYFMSDRSGAENLWSISATGGEAQTLTDFDDGRVLWPSIAADAPVIAFERDFGIWTYNIAAAQVTELDITLKGAVESPRPELLRSSTGLNTLAVSPDGKKMAFVTRGEVFAASASDGGDAFRVTHSMAAESDLTWSSDSNRLAYLSWRDGTPGLYLYDFVSGEERALTSTQQREFAPRFSPSGDQLAFVRGGRDLMVLNLEDGSERRVSTGSIARGTYLNASALAWSPDGEWIAYLGQSTGDFANVHIVPSGGGESRRASFLANAFSGSLTWSQDGKSIYFQSRQRTEDGSLVRIDLEPRVPEFAEDEFRALFPAQPGEPDDPAEDASAVEDETAGGESDPVEIVFEGIERRVSVVPIGLDVGALALSPDGETVIVAANAEGRQNLYAYPVGGDGPRVPRQLTSTAGGKGSLQFSSDGRELFFLSGGRVQVVDVSSGQVRTVATSTELTVDFESEKMAVFEQGWAEMRDGFYDENFHGADWDGMRERFAPYIRGSKTRAEFNRLMNLMIGELNASHLGHRIIGGGVPSVPTGRLGVRFDVNAFESAGRFEISEIIPQGPADVSGELQAGDVITAVNGVALDGASNLNHVLAGTPGDKVTVTVGSGESGDMHDVELEPTTIGTERRLAYREWVESRRAYVEQASGGRLGYVHLPDMGEGTLRQLLLDLDEENHKKEGIVVDVRNNNGGFVNVYAIDIFARRNYLDMTPRGGTSSPARLQLGQRAILAPSVLVTNQHTLSDGEDFTEGFRALEIGPVVGEPTAGWIIFTSSKTLVDGSTVRMPYIEIRGMDGEVMELVPRDVDVLVERTAGEWYSGSDAQLDAAVRELLRILGNE